MGVGEGNEGGVGLGGESRRCIWKGQRGVRDHRGHNRGDGHGNEEEPGRVTRVDHEEHKESKGMLGRHIRD